MAAGGAVTLISQWYGWPGGPLTDLDTNPGLTITPAAGGAPVHGPSDVAVNHPYVGIYTYTWTVPGGVAPGVYVASWQGLAGGDTVTTSEVLDVTAALVDITVLAGPTRVRELASAAATRVGWAVGTTRTGWAAGATRTDREE